MRSLARHGQVRRPLILFHIFFNAFSVFLPLKLRRVILDHILSGKPRDEVLEAIQTYLRSQGELIRQNKIPLKQYIITKQLTKVPFDE